MGRGANSGSAAILFGPAAPRAPSPGALPVEVEGLIDGISTEGEVLTEAFSRLRETWPTLSSDVQERVLREIADRVISPLEADSDPEEISFLRRAYSEEISKHLAGEKAFLLIDTLLFTREDAGGPLARRFLAFDPAGGYVNYPLGRHLECLPVEIRALLNDVPGLRESWLGQRVTRNLVNSILMDIAGPTLQSVYQQLGGRKYVTFTEGEYRELRRRIEDDLYPLPLAEDFKEAAGELRQQLDEAGFSHLLGEFTTRHCSHLKEAQVLAYDPDAWPTIGRSMLLHGSDSLQLIIKLALRSAQALKPERPPRHEAD